jgi:hypothetical protein
MAAKGRGAYLQTFHALQATDLASAINASIQKVRIAPGDYVPELTAPDGPSTAGGVQAMQHLRLVSTQEGQPTLVVGHANHAAGKAELRTYEHIEAIHRQRFHQSPAVDRKQYDEFLAFAKQLFDALRLQTALVGPPVELVAEPVAPPPAPAGWRRIPFVAVGVAVLVAGLLVAWAILRAG